MGRGQGVCIIDHIDTDSQFRKDKKNKKQNKTSEQITLL